MKTVEVRYVQNKLSKVRKSCVTPEQKSTYKRYRELYNQYMSNLSNSKIKNELLLILTSTFFFAFVITITFYVIIKNMF